MALVACETKMAGAYSSLAVLLTGNFVTILDVFIVNVALPEIQRDLHASNAELQLIMVAYSVSYGAMLLNGARLGDLYGRRRLFLSGMAIFAFASLLGVLALSSWNLIAARGLQGIGAALLMPQVYASLRLLFEGAQRRRAFAVMGAVQGVAGAASQLIGGGLMALDIGGLGWRIVFLVNLPVAAYALVAGKRWIVETRQTTPVELDLVGAVLGSTALAAVLLPAMVGREQHWPWWAIAGLVSSVPLCVAFVAYEARLARCGGAPIIELSLFKRSAFVLGLSATFLFFSAIGSYSFSLTFFLQLGLGQSPLQAAMLFLPSTVAFFIGSTASAPLTAKLGKWAPTLGMVVFAAGLSISVIAGLVGQYTSALSVSVVLQGFGQGIVIPLLLNMVLSTVTNTEAGMASGVFSTTQTMGSAFGVTIVGIILFSVLAQTGTDLGPAVQMADAYGTAFATATFYNLVAVTGGLVLLHHMQRKPKSRT